MNSDRIAILVEKALELEENINNFKPEYDGSGQITEECLRKYDLLETQICGIYHRIGTLFVAQFEKRGDATISKVM